MSRLGSAPSSAAPTRRTLAVLAGVLAPAAVAVTFVLTIPVGAGQPGFMGAAIAPAGTSAVKAPALDWQLDGQPQPLLDLKGRPLRLGDLAGRPAVIEFWATWCPSCTSDVAALNELVATLDPHGGAVIAIASQEGGRADVESFVADHAVTYRVAYDATGAVTRAYGVVGLPTRVIVASDGRIAATRFGPVDPAADFAILAPWLPPPVAEGVAAEAD